MILHQRTKNYISRYAPSEKKLRQFISKKNHTLDIGAFLQEIGYDESIMCNLWIKTFVATHKCERDIREKLLKKGFGKNLIENKIQSIISDIQNWNNYKETVKSLVISYLAKGKSKKYVLFLLSKKYPYFQHEIKNILEGKHENIGMQNEISRYLQKYDISNFKEKAKFYRVLEQKGFDYKSIKNALDEIE